MKKLIVLGSNGQLGKKIVCDFEAFFDVTPLDRNSCDITKFDDLKELFSFGDRVELTNAGKFNGIWFIHFNYF